MLVFTNKNELPNEKQKSFKFLNIKNVFQRHLIKKGCETDKYA